MGTEGAPVTPEIGFARFKSSFCSMAWQTPRWSLALRPPRLRDHHGPIRLLIILRDRKPRPPDSQAAAVQSMHKFSLILALRPIANVRPPRLECLEVRTGGNLAKQLLSRQPHFNVICL